MRIVALLFLFLFLGALHAAPPPLELVKGGVSAYEIVLVQPCTATARLAASELQGFLEKATGVALPIVDAPAADRPHLFIGPNPHSAAVGVRPDDLAPEGFHTILRGKDIHLVGRDTPGDPTHLSLKAPVETGTLSAVYDFLERHLGVMFCWDDPLGTVVPRRKTVLIPIQNLTQQPGWAYRCLAYGPQRAPEGLYGRRLRLGWTQTIEHSHAWSEILSTFHYGIEHPEYFALVNGARVTTYYDGHHGGQLCTTNPEVIDLVAGAAIQYFRLNPDRRMFSISPNDGVGFCECATCRALDDGRRYRGNPKRPVITDRILHFYNAVAAKVSAVYPDRWLGGILYEQYQAPPVKERTIHPRLFLMYVSNRAFNQGVGWAEEAEAVKRWASLSRSVSMYDIHYYAPPLLGLMAPMTSHLIERLRAEQAAGLRGGYLYIGQSYEQLGAGHYLMARLMWDPKADAAALERGYYDALYGPAGVDVLAYYHLLEARLRRVFLGKAEGPEIAVRGLKETSEDISPGQVVAAYRPILDALEGLMTRAEGRSLDEPERQRLARLRDHHDLLLGTVRGFVALGASDTKMLRAAVTLREGAKGRLRAHAPTLVASLAALDKGVTAPLLPSQLPAGE